jgi:hypothetical protein
VSAQSRYQHDSLVVLVRKMAALAGLEMCVACHRRLEQHNNPSVRRCADVLRFTHSSVFREHLALERKRAADRAAVDALPTKRAPRKTARAA